MATVDKTWVFATDNEGLVDVGDSTLVVAHDATGNPGGSMEFGLTGPSGAFSERARKSATGETWETWGVPAGNIVTDVQVISWDYRPWAIGNVTSETVKIRVVDSAAASVHSAGDLVSLALTLSTGSWLAGGAGTSRAIDAGKQASTTDVRLEVQMDGVTTGSDALDTGIDNVLLRITYEAASSGFTNTVPPTVTGALNVGGTLTANAGTWTPTPGSFTYYWHRADDASGTNLQEIAGATGATYTLAAGDATKYIQAGVIPHT